MITEEKIKNTIKNLEDQNEQYETMIWGNNLMINACKQELSDMEKIEEYGKGGDKRESEGNSSKSKINSK